MLAKHVGLFDKQRNEYPEFLDADEKQQTHRDLFPESEREAFAILYLMRPPDREAVCKALEKRLEQEKAARPNGASETGSELGGNGEDKESDFDMIKFMNEMLGEEHIKRSVQARLDFLLSKP